MNAHFLMYILVGKDDVDNDDRQQQFQMRSRANNDQSLHIVHTSTEEKKQAVKATVRVRQGRETEWERGEDGDINDEIEGETKRAWQTETERKKCAMQVLECDCRCRQNPFEIER